MAGVLGDGPAYVLLADRGPVGGYVGEGAEGFAEVVPPRLGQRWRLVEDGAR
ncbi:hypothetical protein ACWD4K_21195 [Streptomyces gelaticus]